MKKIVSLLLVLVTFVSVQAQKNKLNLVVGTYTTECDSKGIYVYDFDVVTAKFSLKNNSENSINPSYLTVSADNKNIYSVNEKGAESTISAFSYEAASGKVSFLNQQKALGADPCYIINDGDNVISANYSGGNIAVFKKNDTGISEAVQVIQHKGKGVDLSRQEGPHVHMVYFSPDKKYVLSNDLGLDKIFVYKYNPKSEKEVLVLKGTASVTAGSGPRHITFSKNGKYVYLVQEMTGALTTFSYKKGVLKQIGVTTILPEGVKEAASADIHISPDGKFLYVSNRGEANDISIFKIEKNGKLSFAARTSTEGKGPRNFVIDPTGKYLLVGHQYSNDIVIFERDQKTGLIKPTGNKIELCSPVCLVFTKQ